MISQLLIVQCGDAAYALPTDYVKEVVAMPACTDVPMGPPHLLGLCNYHNLPLPIYDFANLVHAEQAGQATYSVVVQHGQDLRGYSVENVLGTADVQNAKQLDASVTPLEDGLKIISVLKLEDLAQPVCVLGIG